MLTRFAQDNEIGAYCPLAYNRPSDLARMREAGGSPVVLLDYAHGAVVKTWERNGYDDSDFMAMYYDHEAGEFKTVMFATTRGWSYPCYGASEDATPEVLAIWNAARERGLVTEQAQREWAAATAPGRGRRAVITAQRGQAKHLNGREGEVFWAQEQRSQFGTWSRGWRVGVKVGDEKVFVSSFRIIPQLDLAL